MMAEEGCEMEKEENWQEDGWLMILWEALMGKHWEYRKMRRIYGVNDERTQMAKDKIPVNERLHSEVDL